VAAFGGAGWRGAADRRGQLLLSRLSSANGIDISAAIWFHAGRLPALRTLASATLSVVIVGMGVALGREGRRSRRGGDRQRGFRPGAAGRRAAAAFGRVRRRAGMAAAYGVPLGGALFALEVLRGALALRYVLPAL